MNREGYTMFIVRRVYIILFHFKANSLLRQWGNNHGTCDEIKSHFSNPKWGYRTF